MEDTFDTAMAVFAFMSRVERVKVLTEFAGQFACGDPDYSIVETAFEDAVLKVIGSQSTRHGHDLHCLTVSR